MRIELEQNHTHEGYPGELASESSVESRTAEAAQCLREGIRAAQTGNRTAARTSLLRAAELDPQSESAWLWLSSISEYPEELLAFLTNVLDINPRNARALEWAAATRSLLAKNLVQRGIDAAQSNQRELAAQHFNQALEYDEKDQMAWLWLASLCDSNEGKLSYLEKALEFDPNNESAKAGYQAARNSIRQGLLAEARAAAVAGNSNAANELLDAVIAEEPDAEDAWVLKSHIAAGFDEKIAAFSRVLEINPQNEVARAGLNSLTSIMEAVGVRPQSTPDGQNEVSSDVSIEPEAVTVLTDAASEGPSEPEADMSEVPSESPEAYPVPAPPFDKPAEEPVVDFNGTMLMTTADFGFAFDNVVEVEGEADSDSNEFDDARESSESYGAERAWVDQDELSFPDVNGHVPQASTEVEEIFYEPAPEAPVNSSESAAGVEFADQLNEATNELDEQSGDYWPDAAPIAPPTGNPFDSAEFKNEPDTYPTVISMSDAPESSIVDECYDPAAQSSVVADAFEVPFDAERYSGTIPMPDGGPEQLESPPPTGFETRLVQAEVPRSTNALASCPFCSTENDVQAIACNNCLAVLTLADLELILANHHADKALLRHAVETIEREKASRELSEAELTTLGIGHLNLRNLQFGYDYLHEASQKNPNNVVLSGQVNALLIRLEEIKQQTAVHEAMSKGKTILVVDDSPTVRKLIAGKLEKCGHEVFCSADGVEAMEQLAALQPDLILLDITMPRMDGYQVCKLIRSSATTRDTPVVMISGKDGFFDKVRGRMAGASGYITKPFGPETLMKAVESYLNPSH